MSTSTTQAGRNWLEMQPGHFDTSLLPRKHRKPEPAGLFDVADVAPSQSRPGKPSGPELDGQGDLFSEPGEPG